MIVSLIVTVVVTIIAATFALENTNMVRLSFFGYPVDGQIGLFMLIALGVGIILGILLMTPSLIGRSWALMQHKRKLAKLEKQTTEAPEADDSKQAAQEENVND
jgi:uncharacterized integral membrane protein